MDRDFLMRQSQTAQVRIFTEELLQDGRCHTRREIGQYIEQKRQLYGLPEYRSGHIAGGIQQATVNCERVGRGNFRIRTEGLPDQPVSVSRSLEAVRILEAAVRQMSDLARQIDFLEAGDDDMNDLTRLKESVKRLKEIGEMWREN